MLVARGGRGGKGNEHFKSSTMRAWASGQPGEPGEEKSLRLELKILADAGLLGLPNAGKSTFITQVSAARPKIAAYPFTTLTPNLGVMIDEYDPDRRMVIADIPGLIEGAHEGQGLGLRFLKHVERTRFLVHILSVEDVGEDDPWAGFNLINEELRNFDPELGERQQIEVVNKIDLVTPERLEELKAPRQGRWPQHLLLFPHATELLSSRWWKSCGACAMKPAATRPFCTLQNLTGTRTKNSRN